ncbi:hypothetical protein ACHQM5_000856 [Ranunculus cassubicifolius]
MASFGDFLDVLGYDISSYIVGFLDNPADIVRVSSVSRSWRRFVIENGSSKKLCLKLFPELSNAAYAIEAHSGIQLTSSSVLIDLENLSKKHKVYIFLALGLFPTARINCMSNAIKATSTISRDMGIRNTLEPLEIGKEVSYWSSYGERNDMVPETLKYKLISNLCFITEINIQPFQDSSQTGHPIFSAKAVQFRVSYHNSMLRAVPRLHLENEIEWTYLSPVFPMAQENGLQKFELPEPVLCIDGTLEIHFVGRVQRHRSDNLYYICVAHVQVVGRAFVPGFAKKLDHPRRWGELLSLG